MFYYVDSMATFFVVPDASYLVTITDTAPSFGLSTAAGPVPVEAVGTAYVYLLADDGTWLSYEVHNGLGVPSSPVLYSTRVMRAAHALWHPSDLGLRVRRRCLPRQ